MQVKKVNQIQGVFSDSSLIITTPFLKNSKHG